MADILLLAAHPDLARSRVSAKLLAAAAQAPALQGRLELRDLYARYPDYHIDVPAEQRALADAHLLIWLHPLHWYGMPALLKLWVDEVLSFGWAYGPGGHALRGKRLWLVCSTGGSAASYAEDGYNLHPVEAFLLPQTQTARLTGMHWLPPLLLHGAHSLDDAAVEQHSKRFVQLLQDLADPGGQAPALPADLDVPLDARPALFSVVREH